MADDDVKRPAPPGFEKGDNWNSDDARRAYEDSGHDFDAIQTKQEPPTFADGSVAPGTAPADDVPELTEPEPAPEDEEPEPEPEPETAPEEEPSEAPK